MINSIIPAVKALDLFMYFIKSKHENIDYEIALLHAIFFLILVIRTKISYAVFVVCFMSECRKLRKSDKWTGIELE